MRIYERDKKLIFELAHKHTDDVVIEENAILVQGKELGGTSKDAVVSVNGKSYDTIADCLKDNAEATITIIKNTNEQIDIPNESSITIENNEVIANTGKANEHTVINNGNLIIEGTGTVDSISDASAAISNNESATCVLKNVTIDRSKETGASPTEKGDNSYYNIFNHGVMTLSNVIVKQNGKYSSLIDNGWYDGKQNTSKIASTMTIESGTFEGGRNVIKNDDYGICIINGGTFNGKGSCVILNWHDLTINDGVFNAEETVKCLLANGYLSKTMDKGQIVINGGTFNSVNGTAILFGFADGSKTGGSVTINSGTFNAKFDADLELNYTVTIKGGKFIEEVPSKYLANGYQCIKQDSYYIVTNS